MVIVKNNAPSLHGLAGICRLMPGANEVEDEAWEKVKDFRAVKRRLESGEYEVLQGKSDGIKGFTAKKAAELVKETYDMSLLEKWDSEETRPSVRKALKEQIEFMRLPAAEEENN